MTPAPVPAMGGFSFAAGGGDGDARYRLSAALPPGRAWLDLIYWPTVQMITWGFIQSYVSHAARAGAALGCAATITAGTLIGAMLLWDMLFRGQLGFSASFLEEMWSHNVGNLMMSPLRPLEFVAALMIMSVVRLALGLVSRSPCSPSGSSASTCGGWGWRSACSSPTSSSRAGASGCWSAGLLLRQRPRRRGAGLDLHVHACCRWPASTIPSPCCRAGCSRFAWALPPTYVFEGLRALLTDHVFRADLMLEALAINVRAAGGVRGRPPS